MAVSIPARWGCLPIACPRRLSAAPRECGFEQLAFVGLLPVRKKGEATAAAGRDLAARGSPLAAAVANLISNLPAVPVLLSLAARSGAGLLLAVLLGVNIGPNLT